MTYDTEHPYDASFSCGMLSVNGRKITAFSDDVEPVRVENVTVAELIPSVNGGLTIGKKQSVAKIFVSVIAGTDDEKLLRSMFASCVKLNKDIEQCKIELQNGHGHSYKFDYCICIGATPAFSVSASGKIQAMTYVFGAISNALEM